MTLSPRLIKGGLVSIDARTSQLLSVIAFQYNPETLTRTVQAQSSGTDAGDRSQALRLRGAAVETIRLEAEIDATDHLEDAEPTVVAAGIHPQLAALESLLHPTSSALLENHAMAASGVLEILPLETPLTLFVWGSKRVVPVRVTELSITEEAFDTDLNPTRAKVTLGLRVLSVDDLGFDHPGGTLFMAHLIGKEALAAGAPGAPISTLGLKGV